MDSFYIWHKWLLSLEGVSCVTFFSEFGNLNFWQIFEIFRPWPWKKNPTVLHRFFPYLAQMITNMRGCVAYNDLWPWPISSRSFSLDQGWGQIRICICKYKYKYKYGVFVFVFVFDQISNHVFVFVFVFDPPYLVYLANTFSNTLFSWPVF